MIFRRAAVIGIGLIGGSFALAAKRAGVVEQVIGVGRSEATRRGALELGAADEVTVDAAHAVAGADLVYLAAPVDSICASLRALGPSLSPSTLVTDAGSAKVAIMEAASALPGSVTFIGGHPMAGSEQKGIDAARADLFEGSSYFLTPAAGTGAEPLARLSELVSALGAKPILVEAERHDRMAALSSHLPHLLSYALCSLLSELDAPAELAPFVAGAWRDMTRIAGSSPEMWAEIFRANRGNVLELADRFGAELVAVRAALEAGDEAAVVGHLERAHLLRGRIAPI